MVNPRRTPGKSAFIFLCSFLCTYPLSFLLCVENIPPLLRGKLTFSSPTPAPNEHFNYWNPLCATCILHLAPYQWVGYCTRGSVSISCLDKKHCEAIQQNFPNGREISRTTLIWNPRLANATFSLFFRWNF